MADYGECMRFPRLPWGPQVPPSDTEEGLTFNIRFGLVLAAFVFVMGLLHATGLLGNSQRLGLLLMALGVAVLYSSRQMARVRRSVRAAKDDDDQPSP